MTRLVLVALMLLLAACEATVQAPPPSLDPNTPQPPVGTPSTSTVPPATRVPTNTPQAAPPTLTPQPSATISNEPTLETLALNPRVGTDLEPPIRIDLLDGWTVVSDALMLPDFGELTVVPFAFYSGPVAGGTGNIAILYGFENLVPEFGDRTPNVYADALRLLLFAVIEPTCEYSFEEERQFFVGDRQARGTVYAADTCPEDLPSLSGWFAALNVDGLNFAFYAYVEPIAGLSAASRGELQSILDSVEFDFSLLSTIEPAATP
jgi:hypothetical protein